MSNNGYPGPCWWCSGWVEANEGRLVSRPEGWRLEHPRCRAEAKTFRESIARGDPHKPCERIRCGICQGRCGKCESIMRYMPGLTGRPWFLCCETSWTPAPRQDPMTVGRADELSSQKHLSDDLTAKGRRRT